GWRWASAWPSRSAERSSWGAPCGLSAAGRLLAARSSALGRPQSTAQTLHLRETRHDLLVPLGVGGIGALQALLEHRVLPGDGQFGEAVQQREREAPQILFVAGRQVEVRDLHDQGAHRLPGDLEDLLEVAGGVESALDG